MSANLSPAFKKVQSARAGLLLDQPFFGVLALRLKMIEDSTCPTAWTDGVHMGFNPAFVDKLTSEELTGLIAHEVMHCSNGHPWRRGQRDPYAWNVATDFAINQILVDAGFKLPQGGLIDKAQYAGRWAEWIYDRLPQQMKQQPQAGSGGGQGMIGEVRDAPQGDSGSGDKDGKGQGGQGEGDSVPTEEDWRQATAQALQGAKARGKLPANLAHAIGETLKPLVDWRSVLRRFMQEVAKSDYSWARPNPRYAHTGMFLPSLYSHECGRFAIAIDTSGSIDMVALGHFIAELQSICDEMKPSSVDVIYCDADIHGVDTFERDMPITVNVKGGGGTDFRPVFTHLENDPPQVLIYFTDLDGAFPGEAPDYPTLWAIYGHNSADEAPFGESLAIS